MASKVNVKFVALLVLGAVLVLSGVVFIGARTVTKSAAEHATAGDEFAAKGEWEKAAGSYSKAVNKDRKVEYLSKWVDALEHITPGTNQEYVDLFQKQYRPATMALAAAQPTDAAAQRVPLDLTLFQFRLLGAQPTDWEAFVRQADDVLREFTPGDKGGQALRRYRGIARTNWADQVSTAPDDALTKAKEDLEAALEVDPADAKAMAALGDWYRVAAGRAQARRDAQQSDALIKESIQRMEAFVASNKVALPVVWSLVQTRIAAETQQAGADVRSLKDTLASHHGKIKQLFEQARSEPASELDPMLCYQIGAFAFAYAYPDALKEVDALMAHAMTAKKANVYLMFSYAELQMTGRAYGAAYESLDKIVTMPNLPMSVEGLLLFSLRQEALSRQGSCLLAQAVTKRQRAEIAARALTEEAARAEALRQAAGDFQSELTRVQATRAKLFELYGKSMQLTLLDARIKFFENDLVEARRLLTTYTDQRPNDTAALKLLAEVLLRQNQGGAARTQLERVIRLNPTDIEAMATLGLTLESLGELREAASAYERALVLDPGNTELTERISKLRSVEARVTSDDPVVRVLSQAQEKVTGSPPDVPGALAMVRQLYTDQNKAGKLDRNQCLAIAQALLLLEDREMAKQVLANKAIDPSDPTARSLHLLLDNPDPIDARRVAIEQSNYSDLYKALFKYQLFRRSERPEPAFAELDKAKALEPEHPLVVSAMFDEALAAERMDEARTLAEKAAALNIDRAGGAVFRIRIEQSEGRLPAAAAMAQQVIDADPLSAMGHRLLGGIRLQMQQPSEALASFDRALQINPTDPENIKGKLRAMIQAKKYGEALLFARDRRNAAGGDTEFARILLALEAEAGHVDFAIDRRRRQLARDPSDRDNALELANLLNKTQEWAEAWTIIERLKKEKLDEQSMILAANWHAGQGDMPKARAEWEAWMATLPAEQRDVVLAIRFSEFLANNGDRAGARAALEQSRHLQDPNAVIDRQLGDVCMQSGDWQCAIDAYRRALATVTKDENNLLRFRIIEAHLRLGEKDPSKFNEAIRLCEEATAKGIPDNLQLVLLRAEATRGNKDYAGAKVLYDQAVAISPNEPLGFYKRAEFTTAELVRAQRENQGPIPADRVQRMLKDAQDDLEAAIRFDNGFALARRLLSQVRLNQQDPDGAAKLLAEGLAIDPNNGVLRGDLVKIYAFQSRLDDALALIDEGIKRSRNPDWHIMAGDLLRAQAQPVRAAEYYAEAWNRGARSAQLARVYTDTLLAIGQPDLKRVMDVLSDPGSQTEKWSALLTQRAKSQRLLGKASESDADIRKGFQTLDQGNASAVAVFFQDMSDMFPGKIRDMIAMIESLKPAEGFTPQFIVQIVRFELLDATLRPAALSRLDTLVGMKDINIPALYSAMRALADQALANRAYQSAADVYERIIKLKPDDWDATNNLAYTYCKHLARCQDALPLAQKAVEMLPDSPNVKDTLGVVLLELGRVGEAESTLLAASEQAKLPVHQVPVCIHLAQVALAKGDRTRAESWLQQAEREMVRDPRLKANFQSEFDEVSRKVKGGR